MGIPKELVWLQHLREILGDAFLREVRCVLAHPMISNLFLRTYRYNSVAQWKLSEFPGAHHGDRVEG